MKKSLSEMTLQELWNLFPICLTEHQNDWEAWYRQEYALLTQTLMNLGTVRISHIGSTAIKDIWAKPIVDILVEVSKGTDLCTLREPLASAGYRWVNPSETRVYLNKGYTEEGFAQKVFHLHLRYLGDHDELYFRDYLNEHPAIANAYEKMKLELWKQYEHDRDGYTRAKTEFIKKYTTIAKQLYPGRYN